MWAQSSSENHTLLQSRRHAGLEPDQFGYRESAFSATEPAHQRDDETFDRVDQPLRFSARVEPQQAEAIEYRCVWLSMTCAQRTMDLAEPSAS